MSDLPRYALMEIERRWLVNSGSVVDLSNSSYRKFEDLYVDDSRLRLRKISLPDGSTLFKLGRKYGKRSTLSEPITTLYLTESEYLLLSTLPGASSLKHRYSLAEGFLDVYQRPHPGLMIYELEFEDETTAMGFQPPQIVTREITGDPKFSGFSLAQGHAL